VVAYNVYFIHSLNFFANIVSFLINAWASLWYWLANCRRKTNRIYLLIIGAFVGVFVQTPSSRNSPLHAVSCKAAEPHGDAGGHLPLMGCLHDPANVQQTSSRCNAGRLLEVCWTFAGSCKHPISPWNERLEWKKNKFRNRIFITPVRVSVAD